MRTVDESLLETDGDLDGARNSALAKFTADVCLLGGDDALVAAYRAALGRAGAPSDEAWTRFAYAVRRFIIRTSPATRAQQNAAARLHAILGENADLLGQCSPGW
jgi:hypothetical protein